MGERGMRRVEGGGNVLIDIPLRLSIRTSVSGGEGGAGWCVAGRWIGLVGWKEGERRVNRRLEAGMMSPYKLFQQDFSDGGKEGKG